MRVRSPPMPLLNLMVVTHTCNFTLPFISPHTCSSIVGVRGEVGRGKGEGGRAENGKVEWSEGERGQRRSGGGGGRGLGVGESYSSSRVLYMYCANCRHFQMAVLQSTLSTTQRRQNRTYR